MFRVPSLPAIFALLALALPGELAAAPVPPVEMAQGQAIILRPITLVKLADMEFASLGVTTGGTATIDPISGNMTLSGGLIHLAGTPSPARYAGAASRQTVVNIRIPKQPILIRRVGGTETLTVSNFTLDGQDKKALAQQQSFHFAVGARITVPANTVEGLYEGEIDVTVHYP
jgi:hypothetical protein